MLEKVSIVFSICMSITSLIIAVLSYRLKIPKIKIQIIDKKADCFFGNVLLEHNEKVLKSRVSGIRLRIINNSPSEVSIMDVLLKCDKEIYRLIDCKNNCWEVVEFVFPNKKGVDTTDGSAIYYGNEGIKLPLKIGAYDGNDFVVLFHNFPASIKKIAKAKVITHTTFGVKNKNIKLFEYDNYYENHEYKEWLQYNRSIRAEKKL